MNYSSAWFDGDHSRPMERRASRPRCAARSPSAACSPATACWRSAAAGARWPRCASARVRRRSEPASRCRPSSWRWAQQRLARAGPAPARPALAGLPRHRRRRRSTPICSDRDVWRPWAASYWPTLLRRPCSRQLKPGGRACIQSITIRDDAVRALRATRTDFIQQYIFPGGCLPCPREFHAAAEARRAGGGQRAVASAPTTPRRCAAGAMPSWRAKQACARWASTAASCASGSSTWRYCEAAFATGDTSVMQFTLRKPAALST